MRMFDIIKRYGKGIELTVDKLRSTPDRQKWRVWIRPIDSVGINSMERNPDEQQNESSEEGIE